MIEGKLLLVIPSVVEDPGGEVMVDGDFANNLDAYLREFREVTVMCPARHEPNTFPSTREISDIPGHERLRITVLPDPYREDRYLLLKKRVGDMLRAELRSAEFILISPHAAFDWSTLAAEICIAEGIPYNMEADWNLPEVGRYLWSQMPFGPNKLRKYFWQVYHNRKYYNCLRRSALSLLQGGDVYTEFARIAPNAHSVLNVQVGAEDHISPADLTKKLARLSAGEVPRLVYTGRANDIKGPIHWLDAITALRDAGHRFEAFWAGDGELLPDMRRIVTERGLGACCTLLGKIDRDAARDLTKSADIFLFCHMTKESPRCLVEALAYGTPIVGFGTDYSRDLAKPYGGGVFVERGDAAGLAKAAGDLLRDPAKLRALIGHAAESGKLLERDRAIMERITLMKTHLVRKSSVPA